MGDGAQGGATGKVAFVTGAARWQGRSHADAEPVFGRRQAMTIPAVESEDISNAVLRLASDEARYVTGMQLRVHAGGYLKWSDCQNTTAASLARRHREGLG